MSSLEFSEIIGNGTQETPQLVDEFQRCLEDARPIACSSPRIARWCPAATTPAARPERNRHRQHPSRHGSRSPRQDAERFHPAASRPTAICAAFARRTTARSASTRSPSPPTGAAVRLWRSRAADTWLRLDHSQHHVRFRFGGNQSGIRPPFSRSCSRACEWRHPPENRDRRTHIQRGDWRIQRPSRHNGARKPWLPT